jgi:hypothetical protein
MDVEGYEFWIAGAERFDELRNKAEASLAELAAEREIARRAEAEALLMRFADRIRGSGVGTSDAAEAEPAGAPPWKPTTTWEAVATVIGVSTTTLRRARAKRDDRTDKHFATPEVVWAWWRALTAAPEIKARKTASLARKAPTDAVDWDKTKV